MNKGKVAIISGGLGDIGRAIAVLMGCSGIRVAISDLQEEKDAEPVLQAMRREGCKDLFYMKVDVSSEMEVAAWVAAVEARWGIPQIVVPNAGIVVLGSFVKGGLEASQARRQLDVNFWGSYYVATAAAKRMVSRALPGRIIFMGSWAAERADSRIPAYCISKAAVRMLCKTLALELAEDQILVNEIAPGIVAGGLSKKNQQKDPELMQRHVNAIPVHQLVPVEEIAGHVLRMSSFDDMHITGTTLLVDGGLSLTSKMTS